MRFTPPVAFHTRAAASALLVLALGGCATWSKVPDIRWPPPPEVARIKFVRAFTTEDDLKKSALRSAIRVVVPPSPEARIAQPTGLALSPDEKRLYVACASEGRVLRVDRLAGSMDVVANKEGRRPRSPFGVALDQEGNLYVTDKVDASVWVYSPDNEFLRRMAPPELQNPTGVAIDRRRQLLYVVAGSGTRSEHHRVEVLSLQGKHLRTIGTRGSGPGQFNFPANITVAPDGNLYVVDMLNFRLQVFDPDGQLVGMFGTIGAGQPGTFDKAKSVAVDAFGNVHVVDSQQGYVQIFNPKFQPLMAYGGRARLPGFMQLPTDIVIDSRNSIFVADFAGGRVNEYVMVNTTAEDSYRPSNEVPR